ncbi:MAG: ATP-binding protein [Vicinamibacteria bacterium]
MNCPRCSHLVADTAEACPSCQGSLIVATLDVVRGEVAEKRFELRPRDHSLGRARGNDITLVEPSVSKSHARLIWEDGRFEVQDLGSTHGVYIDGLRVERAALPDQSQLQLGNVTLSFDLPRPGGSTTAKAAPPPWIEQQRLVLSLIRALSSTLELSEVLERVLEGIMRITRAERGFILLAAAAGEPSQVAAPGGVEVADLRVALTRRRDAREAPVDTGVISTSVVRRALSRGETIATGNALTDPALAGAQSVAGLELRTIVCLPLLLERSGDETARRRAESLGVIYVDNPESSAPFSPESLGAAEALARHAVLAIENARLFATERRRSEELRLAQRKLVQQEKLATIGQMASGLAHELNTPLTYIMGNVELLQTQGLGEPQQEMLRSIGRGAERIQNLAQALLAFARPAHEELRPLDLNEVVLRGLELCHYHLLKGGVRLQRDLAPSLPRVAAIANQLEVALINLVVNAIHALDGEGELRVATLARNGEVELSVSDDGPGIPPEIQGSLFEPFVTTKPEGKGTGLGLSTVLMVAERHGGRIEFTTAPGKGTTFRLTLPALPARQP